MTSFIRAILLFAVVGLIALGCQSAGQQSGVPATSKPITYSPDTIAHAVDRGWLNANIYGGVALAGWNALSTSKAT
jgi:hypothetical protein